MLCAVLMAVFIPAVVLAAEDDYTYTLPVVLTYDEALALALEDIPALQSLESRKAELTEERGELNDDYRHARRYGTDTAILRVYRRELTELDRRIEHITLDIDIIKLRREQTLVNVLTAIANINIDIETTEASIALTTEQVRRTERMHSFGFASTNELRIAKARLTQEEMSMENLLIAKANVVSVLNNLLGLPAYSQTYVEFERGLPEIPENLTEYIETLVMQAPTIRQIQFDVYRHREALTRHITSYRERNTRPRRDCDECEALQNAYEQIVLERDIAIRNMETTLRTAYSNLEQLLNQEISARQNLARAEDSLQTVKTNFELGRTTQFEIDNAQFLIFSAQQAVERILYQQWAMVIALENPVLL